MKRDRLTWNGGRAASAPPAVPGYDVEDQDHPAHQPDPEYGDYAQGDPSAWAEDPRQSPYPQGNPPSDPGYDTEDQDHPAHVSPPRVPKEARGLQAAILAMAEKKADKCLKLASLMLHGRRGVTAQTLEDQAFAMMDWEDENIDATLDRMSGGFLAEKEVPSTASLDDFEDFDDTPPEMMDYEEDMLPVPDETVYMEDDELDALLAEDEDFGTTAVGVKPDVLGRPTIQADEFEPSASGKKSELEMLASKIQALTAELEAMKHGSKRADQKLVEEEKEVPKEDAEEKAKKEAKRRASWSRKMAEESDEEVKKDEVKKEARRRAAYALRAAEEEIEEELEVKKEAGMDDELTPEETALLAEMETTACGEMGSCENVASCTSEDVPEVEEASMFAQSDEMGNPIALTEEDAILAEIFGGKVAAKKSEEDEDELEDSEKDDELEDSEKDDELEDSDEKAGGKKAKKSEDEETEELAKEAHRVTRTAAQRPQPRKPSNGISRVGSVTRQAAGTGEVAELSKLWETAIDVSDVFGNK